MKKLIAIAVILMGVSTTAVQADDHMFVNIIGSELKVKNVEGLKFKVTAANLVERTYIEVKDNSGIVLYKEVNTADFAKVLDLSSLEDGKYTIVLTTGDKAVEKTIEIKTETTVVRSAVAAK
ncbi:hypothetical protein [Jiulongibacter sp. NS-SX5]|uniref:hypothetical protein n=1 Tax=Jiulongibacter sp. NS-SX5 TaxID=3463854 RepID=UPI004059EF68